MEGNERVETIEMTLEADERKSEGNVDRAMSQISFKK